MQQEAKQSRYDRIYKQIKQLIIPVQDPQSSMATITAVLHNKFKHFFWTGFYNLNKDRLLVNCYQGPLACLMLKPFTGVCWAAIDKQETIVVPNVHEFAGHIACDSRSNSEIVVPVWNQKQQIVGVLDIDSREFDAFDEIDVENLQKITQLIYHL